MKFYNSLVQKGIVKYMKTIIGIMLKGARTKLSLVFYILLTVGAGFLVLYANSMLMRVLNDYLLVQNFYGFAFRLFITIGAFILVFGVTTFGTYLQNRFQYTTLSRLARHYIERLLHAKNSYFTNRSSAEIYTKLFRSSEGVCFLVGSVLSIVSYATVFIFYGVLIFRLDLLAGVFSVVTIPLYIILTINLGDKISDLAHERLEYDSQLSAVTQEAFENVSNVKAKSAYSFFVARSAAILRGIKRVTVWEEVLSYYFTGITNLLRIVAPLLIILGAIRFSSGFTGDAGSILVLYINIPLFLYSFAKIHEQFIEYRSCKPFLSQLREFNDVEPEDTGGTNLASFESLRTEGVKVKFAGGRVITVPDFDIKNGEKVMFFGESGIGKSTIFNIIMGLNREYRGNVLVNGINLREISLVSLRTIFGITFQNTNALTLNLRSNILLGADKTDDELRRLIKLSSLENRYDAKGDEVLNNKILSGGEKSRIGLAQMLVPGPQVMLIDEAFSNMDEELESKIISDLFGKYPDRAVICISHRNSSRPFFDRVVDFNALEGEFDEK